MKRSKILFFLVLVIVIVSTMVGCSTIGTTKYETEIVEGSLFEYEDMTELQKEWKLTSGGSNSSVFSLVDTAIKINTSAAGYARVSQKMYLRNYSYYKVTYTFSTSSMSAYDTDKGYVGLYVGFEENPEFNIGSEKPLTHRVSTSKRSATFYFKTENISEVTLGLNVGTEENPVNASNVTIYDVSVQRVAKGVATGTSVAYLYELTPNIYGNVSDRNVFGITVAAILTLVFGYMAYVMIARFLGAKKEGQTNKMVNYFERNKRAITSLTLVALGIRLLITGIVTIVAGSMAVKYLGFDIEQISKYGEWMSKYGTTFFFKYNESAVFAPMNLMLTMLIGNITKWVGGNAVFVSFLVKLISIAADIGAVLVIFKIVENKLGKIPALIAGGVYALLPVTMLASSVFGEWESIVVLLIILTFYFILNKKYISMSVCYLIAFMFEGNTALYVLPIILLYAIYTFIKCKDNKLRITMAACVLGGFVIFYLMSLPFTVVEIGKGDVFLPFKLFIETVHTNTVYTANAFNFQALLGNNFSEITTQSTFIIVLFVMLAIGLVTAGYLKNRNRLELVLLGATMVSVFFTFTNRMTPENLLVILPLLLIYASLAKDKRAYMVYIAYAMFAMVNIFYILSVAGYTDAGVVQLTYANGVMYWFGAISLVLCFWLIYVTYDVVVSRHIKTFAIMTKPYPLFVKEKLTNISIFFNNLSKKIKKN